MAGNNGPILFLIYVNDIGNVLKRNQWKNYAFIINKCYINLNKKQKGYLLN